MDSNDELDKASFILKCCELCDCHKEDTVLIGDSINDYIGSQQVGVNFIGVTYGFGFKPNKEYDFITIDSPLELANLLHY